MATYFRPRNKRLYPGKFGRFVLTYDGSEVAVLGTKTYPAEHTRDRKPLDVVFIRPKNCATTFQVRPCDVTEEAP
jgi:hypothetical protein